MQPNLQTPQQVVEIIFACFQQRGHQHYGEDVTEQEHALQCACLAAQAGEPEGLVAACLLHDIGHLLHDLGEDIAEQGVDAVHEEKGAVWLAISPQKSWSPCVCMSLPSAISVPELRVMRKRFLRHLP